jgi:hypothetical protein
MDGKKQDRGTDQKGRVMMRLNRYELRALHSFGCDNYALTCQRLNWAAACATAPDAKKLYRELSARLFNECTEQDYRHLRGMVMRNMDPMTATGPEDPLPPAGEAKIICFPAA